MSNAGQRVQITPNAGFLVLSRDPAVRTRVVDAAHTAGQLYRVARDAEELFAQIDLARPRAVVIDLEDAEAESVLQRLSVSDVKEKTLLVLAARDVTRDPPTGAHVLALEPALGHALGLADRALTTDQRRPVALDRLLKVSVLSGGLDDALDDAAEQIAAGFGVERCVISVRGDSTGGVAAGAHTWDSLTWSQTADFCRAAAASGATLITTAQRKEVPCESYVAVPLDTPLGSHGFLGLVVERARVFPKEYRLALQAIASRLGTELGVRAVHRRTAEELDRLSNGPGVDAMLGIWNRAAMNALAEMQVSGSRRSGLPLTVAIIDVQDLAGINTRHGLDVGDRVLRRIADSLRSLVRAEDVIGRWTGDKLAVFLHGTAIDGATRVAERIRTAIAQRPLELPMLTLPIPAIVGLAQLQPTEEIAPFVTRAIWAAKRASSGGGVTIARASTGPAPRLSQQSIEVGEELRATLGGSYRLLHEISRGGMGVVYRAEDLALERPVAVKMLRPDLAEDRAFVEQLRGEAAMLARIQHPNLVQIYNFGQTGGDSYFVMELVEGEALQQAVDRHRIEGTTMPAAELVPVIEQIASALDALHDRGIIHRDVKPANVIRDPFRSRSVLVDVGIARRYGQFAESAGTPGYVAPEVIGGQEATARADVYGLAATAYTLLTLQPPWGDGDDVLARQLSGLDIPAPSSIRADLESADQVLLEALSSDPLRRPSSATAFARALREALHVGSPAPKLDSPRWVGNTVMPSRAGQRNAQTRGVVFRSVSRALGIRDAERLRDALGGDHADLARALTDTAPLAWQPTELFSRLLAVAPQYVDRDAGRLAGDIARASVRASFRRFFPASAATLVPERTLSAIRNVWGRYQSWGQVSSLPVNALEVVVRISDTPRDPALCMWAAGMLEQLVVLSGGRGPAVAHESCEARDDEECLYRVTWARPE